MTEQQTLCVVGLGLIGGSVAACLKARGAPWQVRAVDRRRSTLDFALKKGLIDEAAGSLAEGVAGADLVLLAAPVGAIRRTLEELAGLAEPGQVVTDAGSTKASIVTTALETLPPTVPFVGGHPIAGVERSGVERATPGLFEGRICVLTPLPETPRHALETVTALWREVAAEVVLLDPETHDRIFALVSHLPHLIAYSLVDTVASELSPDQAALAGGALRDFTRVAQSPPGLWREIALENRAAVARAIDDFTAGLGRVRAAVAAGDGAALQEILERAEEARSKSWVP